MATFSPTLQFPKRWLATPSPVKQIFHQELDDIIHMLGSEIPAKDYQFTNQNFGDAVAELLNTPSESSAKPAKLVHSFDSTSLTINTDDDTSGFDKEELSEIQRRITTKLSAQLDDFLTEHLAQLSEDLKSWIDTAIKNELSDYRKTDTTKT